MVDAIRKEQQVLDNYACTSGNKCKAKCIRKIVFRSPHWFSGWLDGEPEKETNCKFYKEIRGVL